MFWCFSVPRGPAGLLGQEEVEVKVQESSSKVYYSVIGQNLIEIQSLGLDIQVPPDIKTCYDGQMSINM